MKTKKKVPKSKVCRRCETEKKIKEFRVRTSGFILNQCKECESELGRIRRAKKTTPEVLVITTKRGKEIEASLNEIVGGNVASSPLTDKVLYFGSDVNRDTARVALSTYAEVSRTGIKFEKV